MLISLDLLIALPIIAAAFLLLFYIGHESLAYDAETAFYLGRSLLLFDDSQALSASLQNFTCTNASRIVNAYANRGVRARLLNLNQTYACNSSDFCRVSVFGGAAKLLVVYYENTDKS
ncbi:MAG: hypothetical protein ACP5MC_01095 [Candidatus Micrarchaeia archaeon]